MNTHAVPLLVKNPSDATVHNNELIRDMRMGGGVSERYDVGCHAPSLKMKIQIKFWRHAGPLPRTVDWCSFYCCTDL